MFSWLLCAVHVRACVHRVLGACGGAPEEASARRTIRWDVGGGQVAVVVKCQDAWTAFVTSFANERLGLAAAHDPLWEELLQTVQPADRWDVEHLTEGPEGGLSGAALLHLLQQQNVLQHAASWSHVSVDMSCGSIGQVCHSAPRSLPCHAMPPAVAAAVCSASRVQYV